MIKDTIKKIQHTIEHTDSLNHEKKHELKGLLTRLTDEINNIDEMSTEDSEKIKTITDSLHDASTQLSDSEALQTMIDNLNDSIQQFGTSHPRLINIINSICMTLSNMGI